MDPTGRQRLVLSLHTALTRCRDGISERGYKPPRQPTRPWLGSESRTSLCWEKEGQTQAAENTSRRPLVNFYAPCLCFMKEAETQSSVYQYRYSHHRPRARGYEVFRWMVCYNKLLINTKCTFLSKWLQIEPLIFLLIISSRAAIIKIWVSILIALAFNSVSLVIIYTSSERIDFL